MMKSTVTDDRIETLRNIEAGPEVLSVYLSLALGRSVMQGHRAALGDTLREGRARLDPEAALRFDAEAERVMRYLERDFDPQGRTLLLFSSQPRDLWVEEAIQAEIPSQARFGPRPFLRPLEQEPTGDRACFVVVDRESSRTLTLRLGSVEMDKHSRDYFPRGAGDAGQKHQRTGDMGNPRQGGDAAGNFERSREAWADQHFRKTIDLIEEVDGQSPFRHLIVGGTRENTSRFLEALPEHLGSRVSGEVPIEIDRPVDEFVNATNGLLREKRGRLDLALVDEALDGALSGANGSAGWDDTLSDLLQGRVRDLLVAAGRDAEGGRCPEGHYAAREVVRCPVCRAEPVFVPSLLDLADTMARDTGAAVRIVNGEAATRLDPYGGAAARLRF